MKIVKVQDDKERGTQYFNIEKISNWDLQRLYRLLVAESYRAKVTEGFGRGSKELLVELEKLAKKRQWNIHVNEKAV